MFCADKLRGAYRFQTAKQAWEGGLGFLHYAKMIERALQKRDIFHLVSLFIISHLVSSRVALYFHLHRASL